MPDVTSGLEPDELSGLDPDSDAGFAARLAQKVQGDDVTDEAKAAIASLDKGDRSVQAGLQESAPTTPRDDQGRFAPAAQESEEEEEGAAPDEEEQEEDDPIARFIEQHGDEKEAVAAALREKEEAQSLIGRQGNELGETRKREQELAERLARLEGRLEATPAGPPRHRSVEKNWTSGSRARTQMAQGGRTPSCGQRRTIRGSSPPSSRPGASTTPTRLPLRSSGTNRIFGRRVVRVGRSRQPSPPRIRSLHGCTRRNASSPHWTRHVPR
jgi:hypothetical protein